MTLVWAPSFNGVTDPDAQTYIAAVEAADGQAIEGDVALAINDFVVGCKLDGIWDAIKASCILAGARTLSGALVPLKGTAPTNNNFVSGDYDRETGLKGDGSTKYLDSNRFGNDDPQDSHHTAVFASTVNNIGYAIATNATENGRTLMGIGALPNQSSRSSSQVLLSTPIGPGFLGHSRQASLGFNLRVFGGTSFYNLTSDGASAQKLLIYARGLPGAPVAPSDARLSFYSIGESLDLAALDNRVTTLMTDIGAAIP